MKSTIRTLFLALMIVGLLAGCNGKTTITPSPTPLPPVATETPVPTRAADRVLLITSSADDAALREQVNAELTALSAQASLPLETRETLQPSDLTPDIKVAVFISVPANLNDLLNAGSSTQFMVLSGQDLPAAGNLTVIRLRPEFAAFIAGYIAEMITTDWRVAGLFPADDPNAQALQDAFQNGGRYWCGTCARRYAPFVDFPLVAAQPGNADVNTWRQTVDQLEGNRIYTLVFWGAASNSDVLNTTTQLSVLTEQGIYVHPTLLGNQTPPDAILPYWVVTLNEDVTFAFRAVWADLMIAKGGRTVNAGVALSHINEEILSIGKQRLVDETTQNLVLGLIDPFNPQQ
jgi:hypothetical protein